MRRRLLQNLIWSAILLAACSQSKRSNEWVSDETSYLETDSHLGTDADTDTDADSDVDSDTDMDIDSDSDGDTDTDVDSDTDTDIDSDTDTDIDSDTDSYSDTGTDNITHTDEDTDPDTETALPDSDPQPHEQQPVTINVINQLDHTIFLSDYFNFDNVEMDVYKEGEWHFYLPGKPACVVDCEDMVSPDECCEDKCHGSGPPFSLFAVNSEQRHSLEWDGSLWALDADSCSDCACRREVQVMTGVYRARVCAYNDIVCNDPAECEEIFTGPLREAEVTGDYICYGKVFEIPYNEEFIEIIVSKETIIPVI